MYAEATLIAVSVATKHNKVILIPPLPACWPASSALYPPFLSTSNSSCCDAGLALSVCTKALFTVRLTSAWNGAEIQFFDGKCSLAGRVAVHTFCTPGTAANSFSTRPAHPAQCMPPTRSLISLFDGPVSSDAPPRMVILRRVDIDSILDILWGFLQAAIFEVLRCGFSSKTEANADLLLTCTGSVLAGIENSGNKTIDTMGRAASLRSGIFHSPSTNKQFSRKKWKKTRRIEEKRKVALTLTHRGRSACRTILHTAEYLCTSNPKRKRKGYQQTTLQRTN